MTSTLKNRLISKMGLTDKEMHLFGEFLIKANKIQLSAMERHIKHELVRRGIKNGN